MSQKINVGLVEDQILFRQGMKAILSAWPEIDVVFESTEGYTVIDRLMASDQLPHVVLVDLSLPPNGEIEFTGREVSEALTKHYPDIKIIILSAHDDENIIAQLIEHGAHGYLVKDCDPQEVHEAIHAVVTRGSYINERALKALIANNRKTRPKTLSGNSQLSSREEEVLQLICQQMTAEEIAERLFISAKTVNGHRNNLLQKTGAKNVAGLVIYAVKNRIVSF